MLKDTLKAITSLKVGSMGVLQGESPSLWMIAYHRKLSLGHYREGGV